MIGICLAGLTLASCSEPSAPEAGLTGEYQLVSVNGVVLASPAPEFGQGWYYTAGLLSLWKPEKYPHHWYGTVEITRSPSGVVQEFVYPGGTYTVSGNTVTLKQSGHPGQPDLTWTGAYEDGSITVTRDGKTFRYQR